VIYLTCNSNIFFLSFLAFHRPSPHCGQKIWGTGCARQKKLRDFMIFLLIILLLFEKSHQVQIYSHCDLNSVSSSTDNIKHLGPIPSSWRIPGHHVHLLCAAASSCREKICGIAKPAALNVLELIIITTCIWEELKSLLGPTSQMSDPTHPHPHGSVDCKACTTFTQSPLCFCSIWLRSSGYYKQVSSVVQSARGEQVF